MADQSPQAGYKQQVAEFFSQLKQVVDEVETDVERFTIKDNEAAGTRVRKAMQSVKELAQSARVAVQEAKNADKAKK